MNIANIKKNYINIAGIKTNLLEIKIIPLPYFLISLGSKSCIQVVYAKSFTFKGLGFFCFFLVKNL